MIPLRFDLCNVMILRFYVKCIKNVFGKKPPIDGAKVHFFTATTHLEPAICRMKC